MSAESTSVTHPDGTTIVTTTEGLVTTTVVTHPDGTKLEAKTEQAADTKPKERVLLPGSVTPSHYDVHLTPWQAGKGDQPGFTGEATVSVTVNEPTETITVLSLLPPSLSPSLPPSLPLSMCVCARACACVCARVTRLCGCV